MSGFDALVVGAGVIGLATARALALSGQRVVVVERQPRIGQGISSRNSEVIHAGLYYPTGSLKARLCQQGRRMLYDLCAARGVAHHRLGKLVVATDAAQCPTLERIQHLAQSQGVNVAWLTAAQAQRMEPALHCQAALWSPDTGILDAQAFMWALWADVEAHQGCVVLGSAVEAAQADSHGWRVQIRGADGQVDELLVRRVVNAAGLHACEVANRFDGMPPSQVPEPRYAKGRYFSLRGRAPFTRLIYPAPQDAWLGIHLTLDLAGQARFGPDLQWLPRGQSPDALDYSVDPHSLPDFVREIQRYWPGVTAQALQPAYSGVRPKIHGPDQPAPDFSVAGPEQHGLPGVCHLFGIESPGMTSALALGQLVAERLA